VSLPADSSDLVMAATVAVVLFGLPLLFLLFQ
jgi:hypothetical protein